MNIIRVRCRTREEFEGNYLPDLPNGGMFCPTTTEWPSGTPAVVELLCDPLPNKMLLRGTVLSWRRALPRMRVRAGATVQFTAQEAPKLDFILKALHGERPDAQRRRHTRLPVALPVRIKYEGEAEACEAELREIAATGALVAVRHQPPVGTELILELQPPGSEAPVAIAGRILYHNGDQTGIKFHYRDGGGFRRLREVVRRFKLL